MDKYGGNLGAAWINIGLCYFARGNPGDFELSVDTFTNALKEFSSTHNRGGCLLATFNLTRCNYKARLNFNHYIKTLRDISKSAKDNGESIPLIDALGECIEELIKFGGYDSAWKYIGEADEMLDIIISLKHTVKLYLSKAELYARRNQHKRCRDELTGLLRLLDERNANVHLGTQARIHIIKLLWRYEEYKDIFQESILYLQHSILLDERYAVSINEALNALKVQNRLFSQPLFLDIGLHSKLSKEDMLRKLIILKEYYGEVNDLPRLFYGFPNTLDKELRVAWDEDLSYSFYISIKRSECGILKFEAMLIYSNALAESEKFALS